MIQLILDTEEHDLNMPESRKGGYSIQEHPLMQNGQMISGRMTREYRGDAWVISHQYGYFDEEQKKKFIAVCEKGMRQSIVCAFLTPDESAMQTSLFLVTDYRRPKFMWSKVTTENGEEKDVPVWGDYYVELREVKPHA